MAGKHRQGRFCRSLGSHLPPAGTFAIPPCSVKESRSPSKLGQPAEPLFPPSKIMLAWSDSGSRSCGEVFPHLSRSAAKAWLGSRAFQWPGLAPELAAQRPAGSTGGDLCSASPCHPSSAHIPLTSVAPGASVHPNSVLWVGTCPRRQEQPPRQGTVCACGWLLKPG